MSLQLFFSPPDIVYKSLGLLLHCLIFSPPNGLRAFVLTIPLYITRPFKSIYKQYIFSS